MKFIKISALLFFFAIIPLEAFSQNNPYWQRPTPAEADSLKMVLQSSENDSLKMYINRQLGLYYSERNRFIALEYLNAQLELAQTLNQKVWEAEALGALGYVTALILNYPGSLNYLLNAREIASDPDAAKNMWNVSLLSDDGDPNSARLTVLAVITSNFGILHYFVGSYDKALEHNQEAAELNEIMQDEVLRALLHLNKGEIYLGMRAYELAKTEFEEAVTYSHSAGYKKYVGLIYLYIGRIFEAEGNYSEAEKYFDLSVKANIEENNPDFLGKTYLELAGLNRTRGFLDSSYELAHKALSTFRAISDSSGILSAHESLAIIFDNLAEIDSAYYHMREGEALRTALNSEERLNEFQVLGLNEQLRLKELETERVLYQSRIRIYGLAAGIGVLLLISMITFRNNRRQKKDKAIIEESYANLKATQNQLVQQEKLASLGQLTAGIAHEIKNPLNFVNNFSEVSLELVEEMRDEVRRGTGGGRRETEDRGPGGEKAENPSASRRMDGIADGDARGVSGEAQDTDLILEILDDIEANLRKIHEHGSRADSIVKSMLMHSRGGEGKMEPTDLNALVKEYANLSFHGMRAGKDAINVDIDLQLDESIDEVPLIAEDFSRVILNLCNNAFDAMRDKLTGEGRPETVDEMTEDGGRRTSASYLPKLSIRTKSENDQILIEVQDNGPGIPDDIKDKILQPFFTTKKGTQGTGLGLSITNDIVKAHGGNITITSKNHEGTTFTIELPI